MGWELKQRLYQHCIQAPLANGEEGAGKGPRPECSRANKQPIQSTWPCEGRFLALDLARCGLCNEKLSFCKRTERTYSPLIQKGVSPTVRLLNAQRESAPFKREVAIVPTLASVGTIQLPFSIDCLGKFEYHPLDLELGLCISWAQTQSKTHCRGQVIKDCLQGFQFLQKG